MNLFFNLVNKLTILFFEKSFFVSSFAQYNLIPEYKYKLSQKAWSTNLLLGMHMGT